MELVTDEKIKKYFSLTERALKMAEENVSSERKEGALVIVDMVSRYLSDAKHFLGKNDKVTCFAALNYAHGWLDCGASLRFFEVNDNTLFTVDDEDL